MKNPRVSLIVPCYNEQDRISLLLDAIRSQTCQLDNIGVIIADGMSDDGTRDVIHNFSAQHPELNVRLFDNPQRIIPAALNMAIEAAEGDVIIRLDAHSAPRPDYVARCLSVLKETGAANVKESGRSSLVRRHGQLALSHQRRT
jgi:glycosyltransferase involved in cell wall biosynthesis